MGRGPPLAADVGRIVFFLSGPEDDEPDIIFQAGNFNMGPFPQLCDGAGESLRAEQRKCQGAATQGSRPRRSPRQASTPWLSRPSHQAVSAPFSRAVPLACHS